MNLKHEDYTEICQRLKYQFLNKDDEVFKHGNYLFLLI